MHIEAAVDSRISCRAFLDRLVSEPVVRDILSRAARAPSGGNLQPWRVHVLTGGPLQRLIDDVASKFDLLPSGEGTEYAIYPDSLWDPFRSRRFQCGSDLYATLGIERSDKAARLGQFERNFRFFDAPVGLFFSIDRALGPPQWSDLGMFIQTVMLLARGHGLATCAQEAWAVYHETVGRHICLPEDHMLFCGMALGYPDERAPVNGLRTERAGVDDFAVFSGFDTLAAVP